MKPVYSKPAHKQSDDEIRGGHHEVGYANNEDEAKGLLFDSERRFKSRAKPKEMVQATHSSGVTGFFPKK